jgi:hypothetical protein
MCLPSRCLAIGLYVTVLMTDIRYAMHIDHISEHYENNITPLLSQLGVQTDMGSVTYFYAVYLTTLSATQK